MSGAASEPTWFDPIRPWVVGALDLATESLADLPPSLARIHRRFLDRLSRVTPGGDWRELSGNLDLFPLLPLQAWLAEDLGIADDPRARGVAAASWLGYCAVRITDDAMDEPSPSSTERLLLGEIHLLRFQGMLRDALGDAGSFWSRLDERWSRYAEATASARERAEGRWDAPTDGEIREVGERFAPAAAPLEAIARLGGREDLVETLDAAVLHLGISVQLMNDFVGLEDDVLAGRWTTATSQILGGEGRGSEFGSPDFWRRVLFQPGVQPLLDRALAEHDAACSVLRRALGDPAGLNAYLSARGAWLRGSSSALLCQALAFRADEAGPADAAPAEDGHGR